MPINAYWLLELGSSMEDSQGWLMTCLNLYFDKVKEDEAVSHLLFTYP